MAATLNPFQRQSASGRFVSPSPFDFVLLSRATLLAIPGIGAGPVYTLPSGSYALTQSFELNEDERLLVATGSNVLIEGFGTGKVLSGDPGTEPLLDVQADALVQLTNVALEAQAAGARALRTAGEVTTWGSVLTCDTLGGLALEVTAGRYEDVGSSMRGGTLQGIRVSGGAVNLVQTRSESGLSNALQLTGATALSVVATACELTGGANSATVSHGATAGRLELNGCELLATADGQSLLSLIGALSAQVQGGNFASSAASPGSGIRIAGALASLQAAGTHFSGLANAVLWVSGLVNRATLVALDGDSTVPVGVDWAAANIPTNGLLELGCQFDTATPYANHTAADARVNRKGGSQQGALSTETAIV